MTNCAANLATTYTPWTGSPAGAGFGSPLVTPTLDSQQQYRTAVTLPRYAQRIRYNECQFFGVRNDNDNTPSACKDFWSLEQRQEIAHYLSEAQVELEDTLGFPLQPTYVNGRIVDDYLGDWRFVDEQPFYALLVTKWGMVIEPGVRAAYLAGGGVTIDQASDPATVSLLTIPGVTADMVEIYHTGSDVRIVPSQITVSDVGLITVKVPRCRTVLPSLANTPDTGLDYDDLGNFASTVDVVLVCTDNSQQAVMVSSHQCTAVCSSTGCQQYTYDGCLVVEEPDIGGVRLARGTYTNGQWTGVSACKRRYETARLYYRAGVVNLSTQMEDAIIRLAHSKMPAAPCGCDGVHWMWTRDRDIPQVLTRERLNCPFGVAEGAWVAYRFAQAMRLQRSGVI